MVKEINDIEFYQEVLQSEKPVLVEFYSPTCAPCRVVEPVVDEAAENYKGKIKAVKIDTTQNPVSKKFLSVDTVPAVAIFNKGKIEEAFMGVVSKDFLFKGIENVLDD